MKIDSNHKGNVAEAAITAAAIKAGIPVLRPMVEHTRYDLVFEINSRLYRIQCKWAPLRDGVIQVRLTSSRYKSNGEQIRRTYRADEVDAVAVYCEVLDQCYLLPPSLFDDMRAVHLRVDQPLNGQKASLNWSAAYRFPGAVAQLDRACGWQPQGRGFESHQLHSPGEGVTTVGANPFRDHFGWYMERAAAGEEFLITRRGRPTVRLSPANRQLKLAEESSGAGGETATQPPSQEP
jgi:prevent-host-death family protein